MHIIINNSSMVPIYEQIIDQIKSAIIRGELQPDTVLPSVCSSVKGTEDQCPDCEESLRQSGRRGICIVTVHGKGTYVAATNKKPDEGRTSSKK